MITIVQNDPVAPAGRLADVLDRRGIPARIVAAGREAMPDIGEVSALVLLGGTMGAYETDEYPFLVAEGRLVVDAVDAGVPVLGICLGSQIIASALGGAAYPAPRPEAVFAPVELTPHGRVDPAVGTLHGRSLLRVHADTFDAPPHATILATGGGYLQAFRVGSALAIQPHPEVTPAIFATWRSASFDDLVARAGADRAQLDAALRVADDDVAETADRFFGGFLAGLPADPRPVSGGARPRRSSPPARRPGLRRSG